MSRLAPAAIQLIEDVTALNQGRKMSASPVDRPDGLGIHRSIEFDAATSKWLVPVLDVIEDERIKRIVYTGKRRATITFVGDTRADHRDPFPLLRVHRILYGRSE